MNPEALILYAKNQKGFPLGFGYIWVVRMGNFTDCPISYDIELFRQMYAVLGLPLVNKLCSPLKAAPPLLS